MTPRIYHLRAGRVLVESALIERHEGGEAVFPQKTWCVLRRPKLAVFGEELGEFPAGINVQKH